ncbi:unnamed protein product [Boreogadus saida]
MSEVAPAPAVASPAKATKKKPAARPKRVGPSVSDLIVKAVAASKERSGVSLPALKKTLAADGYDVEKNNSRVKAAVRSLVTKGTLLQAKGTGASGSFKINKEAKKPAVAKKAAAPKAKKPAAKKPAAAKKAVTPKKVKKTPTKKVSVKKATPKKAKKPIAAKKVVAKVTKKTVKSPKKAPKPVAKKSPAKRAAKPKAAKKAAPKKK